MTAKLSWPDWATRYYWLLRAQIGKLEQVTAWLIENGVKSQNVPRLELFLPVLEATALDIHLKCLEVQHQRDGERWPYWANSALAAVTEQSEIAEYKAAQAGNHLKNNYLVLMEHRLKECLVAAKRMRKAIMSGPAPELTDTDEAFLLNEAEAVAAREFLAEEWERNGRR